MSAKDVPDALSAALGAHLATVVPPELAEVLLQAVRFRVAHGRAIAVLPNPVWREVFRDHAAEAARSWLKERGLTLHVAAMVDAPSAVARSVQRFGDFLQDPGNQLALAACRRVVEAPGLEHNPLYLHGPPGCGKSHLLAAVISEYRESLDASAVVELDGPTFVAREAQRLAEGERSELHERIERAALVSLDRVEALAGRAMAQEALFSLVNDALERGTQLVLAGAAAPQKLPGFVERVASRLAWGLSVAMEAPQIETRLALLTRLAGAAAAEIDAQELTGLVESYAPDMHQVVRLAERLIAGERPGRRTEMASFDRIVQAVADRYGLRPGDIAGQRRLREIARARQVALLLGRRLTSHSLMALGGMVGGRDHSTVLHAVRTAEERASQDSEFARELSELTQEILGQSV
jgi:chromosomal replication initiator protein